MEPYTRCKKSRLGSMRQCISLVMLVGYFIIVPCCLVRAQFIHIFEVQDENRAPKSDLFDPAQYKYVSPAQLQKQQEENKLLNATINASNQQNVPKPTPTIRPPPPPQSTVAVPEYRTVPSSRSLSSSSPSSSSSPPVHLSDNNKKLNEITEFSRDKPLRTPNENAYSHSGLVDRTRLVSLSTTSPSSSSTTSGQPTTDNRHQLNTNANGGDGSSSSNNNQPMTYMQPISRILANITANEIPTQSENELRKQIRMQQSENRYSRTTPLRVSAQNQRQYVVRVPAPFAAAAANQQSPAATPGLLPHEQLPPNLHQIQGSQFSPANQATGLSIVHQAAPSSPRLSTLNSVLSSGVHNGATDTGIPSGLLNSFVQRQQQHPPQPVPQPPYATNLPSSLVTPAPPAQSAPLQLQAPSNQATVPALSSSAPTGRSVHGGSSNAITLLQPPVINKESLTDDDIRLIEEHNRKVRLFLQQRQSELAAEQERIRQQKAAEEAAAKARQEAARVAAEQEHIRRLRAEQEAAAKAAAEQERQARLKAEQEAAARAAIEQERIRRIQAEQEAAARAAAEQERIRRLRAEQEAAARAAAEQERIQRIRAEQEAAARAAAEQERIRRLRAEQEAAARAAAEQEAAARAAAEQERMRRLRAEQEAAARAAAEQERIRRLRAEQEAAARAAADQERIRRLKAEQEAAARAAAEQERIRRLKAEQEAAARAAEEERYRQLREQQETERILRIKAEQEAAARAESAARAAAEQDRFQRIKSDQDRLRRLREEQETAVRVAAEQERYRRIQEDQDRIRKLKAEQDTAASISAEQDRLRQLRAQQEAAARLAEAERDRLTRLRAEQEIAAIRMGYQTNGYSNLTDNGLSYQPEPNLAAIDDQSSSSIHHRQTQPHTSSTQTDSGLVDARIRAEKEALAEQERLLRFQASQQALAQQQAIEQARLRRLREEEIARAQQERAQREAQERQIMRARQEQSRAIQVARDAATRPSNSYTPYTEDITKYPSSNYSSSPYGTSLNNVRTPEPRSYNNVGTSSSSNTLSAANDPISSDYIRRISYANQTSPSSLAPSQIKPSRSESSGYSTEKPATSNSGRHKAAKISLQELPPDLDADGIPGVAGRDYPKLTSIPKTSFSCARQPLNGYYADTETACQVVHMCQAGGVQDSFLCPNGTIWNQEKFACQWWYEVSCATAPSFYALNNNLYKGLELDGKPGNSQSSSSRQV